MKHYLTMLTLLLIASALICTGCQKSTAGEESAAIGATEPAKTEAQPVIEVTPEPAVDAAAETPPTPARRRGGRGVYGEWQAKMDFNEQQMDIILAFSRNQEGEMTGQWISMFGITELTDITFEEGKLGFTQTFPGQDGQTMTSTFTGTIAEGKLSGTTSSEFGESQLTAERSPQMSRAAGVWEMKTNESTSTLTITPDEDGNLVGKWGEDEITDVKYDRRTLTFKKISDGKESTFEGTIRNFALTGVLKSDEGEVAAEGMRMGLPLVGYWDLDVTSEERSSKQRLKVNIDMSGMYGTLPIDKINLEGDQVSFKIVMEFGENSFEMNFKGTLAEEKLNGELTTTMGTQTVTGTKIMPFRRGRRAAG